MIKNHWKGYLVTLAAAATLAAGATPAMAEASSCIASIIKLGNDGCTTGSVGANPSGHFVHVDITGDAHWEVIDVANGIRVWVGQTGLSGISKTIFGLFARYQLELHSLAARGTINNT